MVAVFAIFGTLSMQDMKQMGVGLAVAVLIDATIIRGVLLPAVMTLLGDRNWYLPRWLHRLPDLTHDEAPEADDAEGGSRRRGRAGACLTQPTVAEGPLVPGEPTGPRCVARRSSDPTHLQHVLVAPQDLQLPVRAGPFEGERDTAVRHQPPATGHGVGSVAASQGDGRRNVPSDANSMPRRPRAGGNG